MLLNHTLYKGKRKFAKEKICNIVYNTQTVELREECPCCEIFCKHKLLKIPPFDENKRFRTDFSFQTYKEAIDSANIENVKKLLQHNYSVSGKANIHDIAPHKTKNMSALMYAIEKMEKDIVVEILETRPDIVEQEDEYGENMWDYLVRSFREKDTRVKYTGSKKCSICLEPLQSKKSVIRLSTCKHLFHEKCFDAWEDRSDACPLCRYSVEKRLLHIEKEKIELVKCIQRSLRCHKNRFFPEERMYQTAFENNFDILGEFLDYHDY